MKTPYAVPATLYWEKASGRPTRLYMGNVELVPWEEKRLGLEKTDGVWVRRKDFDALCEKAGIKK